jgi:CRP-like cAMP-binding protein
MLRITAVCDQERGCPLYRKGARLEFSPPSVSGADGVPVCATAVATLLPASRDLAAGNSPAESEHVFCGGCLSGKAWWTFEPVEDDQASHKSLANLQAVLNTVAKMTLFGGVHLAKLMRIVRLMKERPVPAGQIAIVRGRPGEAFYIVLDGEFEVVQEDEHQVESTLAVLPAGECFGEMSLITGEPASATVRARTEASVLALAREDFQRMLAIAPEIAITLARVLANRLARTGRWVIDEMKKGILGRLELISPAELIQAMNVNSQTGMLVVQNGERSLRVYMQDGQILEVELGDKRGEEAFYEFLTWARGNFRLEPMRKEAPVRQVQLDTVGLLLEGMRRADELRETRVVNRP